MANQNTVPPADPSSLETARAWIDRATYPQLLEKWRFEAVGSLWFQGDVGSYFQEKMNELRAQTPAMEQVHASKRLGWKP